MAAFFEVAGTPIRRGAASPAPAASSQCVAVKNASLAESQNVNVFCLKEAQGYLSNHYRIQNVWTRTLPVVGDVIKNLDVA